MKNIFLLILMCVFGCWFLANHVSAEEDDSIPYFSADEPNDYWISELKVAPRYPQRALRRNEEGCAAVGYMVESDGTTSTHRVIASYPSSIFDESSIEAAKQFVYSPTDSNVERTPIYTINSFTFQISRGEEKNQEVRNVLGDICTSAANKLLSSDSGEAGPF